MIERQVLIDGIVGGIAFALFSYFASIYDDNPKYLKISAYLWGVPLFFFYLVYVSWSKSKNAMIGFTKHAIIGTILTVLVMIITLFIKDYDMSTVIVINIVLLFIFLYVYFQFKIYDKI